MQKAHDVEHAQLVVYKGRTAGVIFFAIVHILAGSFMLICPACALAALAIAAAAQYANVSTAISAKTMSLVTVASLAIVVWRFWPGIGSLPARSPRPLLPRHLITSSTLIP